MSLEYLWLLVLALGGTWWVRRDMREYRRFVLLEDTVARRRVYVRWIVQSFTILVGASLGSLWLAGGLWPFDGFPPLFEPAYAALKSTHQAPTRESMLGMALGMTIGVLAIILVQWRRLKRMRGPVHGTADALVPRNHRERAIVVLLSLNAGFSEELFFRLALPLLLYRVTHSLEIALAVSVVCFGLVHAYQGWKGIVLTMAAGAVLTLYYLSHGSLLRVMLVHALIDVIALIIRPAILHWLARRFPGRSSAAVA